MGQSGLMPQNFDELFRLANAIAVTPFCPGSLVRKDQSGQVNVTLTAANCVVAMAHGMELGLHPITALQNTAVINGRPSLFGDIVVAMIPQSTIDFLFDGIHAVKWLKKNPEYVELLPGAKIDPEAAYCVGKRKGNDMVAIHWFDEKRAAHLKGDKDRHVWQKYDWRMKQWRAKHYVLHDLWPDYLKGVITQEEANEYIDALDVQEVPEEKKSKSDRLADAFTQTSESR
jgi:hypothetical protein